MYLSPKSEGRIGDPHVHTPDTKPDDAYSKSQMIYGLTAFTKPRRINISTKDSGTLSLKQIENGAMCTQRGRVEIFCITLRPLASQYSLKTPLESSELKGGLAVKV